MSQTMEAVRIEGPRACRPEELADTIAMTNGVMREGSDQSFLTDYPLVYRPDNLDNIQIIKVGDDIALRKAGHEKIAFLTGNPDHLAVKVQVAAWRGCFAGSVAPKILERRLLYAEVDEETSAIELGHVRTSAYLKQSHADATALISNNDMLLDGALFACLEKGRRVPEDISVMCTLDNNLLKYMQAGVSAIDICVDRQIDLALQMIDAALSGSLPAEERLRLVQPQLIDRKSVLPYPAPKH